ncbi:MAG: DUF4445 domain-containing protein [Clostridia bacterium]|nr:DUF4445 domain-containing protein [Clostridia bacterium]
MPTLTIIRGNEKRTVSFQGTPTIRELLSAESGGPAHPCGGRGICGQCGVSVTGALSEMTFRETELGHRLSCQTRLLGDAEIHLSGQREMRILRDTPAREHRIPGAETPLTAVADIGTTTVAVSLYREETAEPVYSAGGMNPQRSVSDDVIGRIHFASARGPEKLQREIREALKDLTRTEKISGTLKQWIITGNTAMLYLFAGRDPRPLGQAPFRPDCLFDETVSFDGTPAYLPPCVHGFLGADLLCAVLASGMHRESGTALLCDAGTNGEMALWKHGRLYATSVSMGPALEGVGIRQGCGAVSGAIDRVIPTGGGVIARTIDGVPAVGICGSGVIDAVACGLNLGWIDEDGRLLRPLTLRDGIGLTQEDLQAVQLAKAAFGAGLERLMKVSSTRVEEIQAAFLCGGFGNGLNPVSAARIGLWPDRLISGTRILGNAALTGAALLRGEAGKKEIRSLAERTEAVPLGGEKEFHLAFLKHMRFEPAPFD